MAAKDDRAEWDRLLTENRRWLATVLIARGVEPSALEEVLQDVFSAAWEGADQLRDRSKVAPWLYRIAVTSALQHRRRLGRRRRLSEQYADSYAQSYDQSQGDPLTWLLAEEQREMVRQAVASMPSRDAEILLLKYTEDWSYRQLADHLGVSVSALEARLHRARAKMRKILAVLAPEWMPR